MHTRRLLGGLGLAAALLVSAPAPAAAAPPGPVTELRAYSGTTADDAWVYVVWEWPPDARRALVCWEEGATPPAAPGAPADCSEAGSNSSFAFRGDHGQQYAISVFSRNDAGEYGPPASTTVTAEQTRPESMFEDLDEYTVGTSGLRLCWSGDGARAVDEWTIRMAPGTEPPAPDATPIATLPGGRGGLCHDVEDLRAYSPYTFAITGRNERGEGDEVGRITGAPRAAGQYVAGGGARVLLRGSREYGAVGLAWASTRVQAAYFRPYPGGSLLGLFYSRARDARTWSSPTILARRPDAGGPPPFIASNRRGAELVAWNLSYDTPAYRYRRAGARRWGPHARLPGDRRRDRIVAVAVDRTGGLHFLLSRFAGAGAGLHYLTNATGRWTAVRIPGARCPTTDFVRCERPPLMTYDDRSDRLVLVDQTEPRLRIADKPAPARTFGRFHTPADTAGRTLLATAVTSRKGQITVALEDEDGLLVMAGNGPRRVRGLTRVPGTSVRDTSARTDRTSFFVAAATPNAVVLAWQRDSRRHPSWDIRQQGIWLQRRVRDPRTYRWTFRAASHRTGSAYDELDSLALDTRKRAYIGFGR